YFVQLRIAKVNTKTPTTFFSTWPGARCRSALSFFRVSRAIDEVAQGGRRIDAYLQLKTCPSEKLRGKILIDSPGFDADAQRTSTLRITDHIIDLSDLVLVFFDARHPESGSMHDTLEHLVRRAIGRPRLQQVPLRPEPDRRDRRRRTTPRRSSPPGSGRWRSPGLTAGCCYSLYIPELAAPIAGCRRAGTL
ncbi:MAG: hypothetical protein MZV70_20590, partial [Desulfobacterales bacterium]|nr:hypothetical protein [Desulfobacterales bacterium]